MATSSSFRVDDRGGTSPLFDPAFPPLATFDPTGTIATIPLDQPLAAGHYRIVLAGGIALSDFLSGGNWDTGVDQSLADFSVIRHGATLAAATDLGTIGPQVQTVPGYLALAPGGTNVRPVQADARPRPLLAAGA